jgi:hypothetical protein
MRAGAVRADGPDRTPPERTLNQAAPRAGFHRASRIEPASPIRDAIGLPAARAAA